MKLPRVCAVIFAMTFVVFAASSAFTADGDDRPVGVKPQNWLPISDRLAFVVVAEKDARPLGIQKQILVADPERTSADLMPPKKGYFVIKTSAGWQPVVVTDLSGGIG